MEMNHRFATKAVLVTGAAGGIGWDLVKSFALEGARVFATDIDDMKIMERISSADFPTKFVSAVKHDVTSEEDWKLICKKISDDDVSLDILVNNAGIMLYGDFEAIDLAQWRRTHAVNLDAVFLGTQEALSMMKISGGSIVNISSVLGIVGDHRVSDYSSAKAGVRNFTKSIALHCCAKRYPIRVNSVHPGYVRTDMILKPAAAAGDVEGKLESGVARHPIGRLAEPRDISNMVLFLASDAAGFITGAEFAVDGGYLAQ